MGLFDKYKKPSDPWSLDYMAQAVDHAVQKTPSVWQAVNQSAKQNPYGEAVVAEQVKQSPSPEVNPPSLDDAGKRSLYKAFNK